MSLLCRADKGFTVAAFNRTVSKVDHFLANEAKGALSLLLPSQPTGTYAVPSGKSIVGAHSIEELCSQLKTPRKIVLLVKAGSAVDDFIALLEPHLEKGDIIIDGGNSHFPDSIRRTAELESKGLLFVGSGVSGGEEGARHGPSLSALSERDPRAPKLILRFPQCPVDPLRLGPQSRRSSRRLLPRSTARRAATGLESLVLVTFVLPPGLSRSPANLGICSTSRWSTTASRSAPLACARTCQL